MDLGAPTGCMRGLVAVLEPLQLSDNLSHIFRISLAQESRRGPSCRIHHAWDIVLNVRCKMEKQFLGISALMVLRTLGVLMFHLAALDIGTANRTT